LVLYLGIEKSVYLGAGIIFLFVGNKVFYVCLFLKCELSLVEKNFKKIVFTYMYLFGSTEDMFTFLKSFSILGYLISSTVLRKKALQKAVLLFFGNRNTVAEKNDLIYKKIFSKIVFTYCCPIHKCS
jgi:hypothetical protein